MKQNEEAEASVIQADPGDAFLDSLVGKLVCVLTPHNQQYDRELVGWTRDCFILGWPSEVPLYIQRGPGMSIRELLPLEKLTKGFRR